MTFQTKSQDCSPGGLSPSLPAGKGRGGGTQPQGRPRAGMDTDVAGVSTSEPPGQLSSAQAGANHQHCTQMPTGFHRELSTSSGVQHLDPNPELNWAGEAPGCSLSELRRGAVRGGKPPGQQNRLGNRRLGKARGAPRRRPQLPCVSKALGWGLPHTPPDPPH